MERAKLVRRGLRMLESETETKCRDLAARIRSMPSKRSVQNARNQLADCHAQLKLIRKILKEMSIT